MLWLDMGKRRYGFLKNDYWLSQQAVFQTLESRRWSLIDESVTIKTKIPQNVLQKD